tara:strand:+ start:4385 stop:4534 length:150 start_codon:yes stop_codon:yes gene_type:complete
LKKAVPKYIKNLIKNNPNILSGRKNFKQHHYRIYKTIKLINKYFGNKEN